MLKHCLKPGDDNWFVYVAEDVDSHKVVSFAIWYMTGDHIKEDDYSESPKTDCDGMLISDATKPSVNSHGVEQKSRRVWYPQ